MTNRIVLVGSESIGKTSLIVELKKHSVTKDYNFIEEAARQLNIHVTLPEDKLDLQWTIYNMHAEAEDKFYKAGYIADRCTIDSFVYYKELCGDIQSDEEIAEYRDMVLNRVEDYTHIVYTPIQYPCVKDGFRYGEEAFRYKIDYEIKNFLYVNEIQYYTISGKIDSRVNQIINLISEE